MKHIKNLLLAGLIGSALWACDPIEDREVLGEALTPADLNYSITQEAGYDNKVYLENLTPHVIPHWQHLQGRSTREKDTVVFPFGGNYWIKYTAYGNGGALSDSTQVTVTDNDPNYFADPNWNLLTNGMEGKYWKLVRVTLGPATNYNSVWGDVGWWAPDAYNWDDSAYFDLNGGFNYKRYHNGEVIQSSFTFNPAEILADNVLTEPGPAITIPSPNQMPVKDGSNEMSGLNKTHYRVFKLSADTLIVGQGSYYTASRTTEDWSYYHWYVWQK